MGYDNKSTFSQFLNGHKQIPRGFPSRLATLDPRINILFLTGESDDMLLSAPGGPEVPLFSTQTPSCSKSPAKKVNAPENGIFVPSELVQMISDLSATIKDQQKMISSLVDTWVKKQ